MQDGRARLGALIGDDLVAGVIEIEAGERDGRAGGDRAGRGVGDGSFARPEPAGGQPPVVGKIDAGTDLDVAQKNERECIRGTAVVLNDGDVAGGENGGHGGFLPLGSNASKHRAEIRADWSRRRRAVLR